MASSAVYPSLVGYIVLEMMLNWLPVGSSPLAAASMMQVRTTSRV